MILKSSDAAIGYPCNNCLNVSSVFKAYSIGEISASDVCPCENSARRWVIDIGEMCIPKGSRVEMGLVEARSA
jgi:hypothetical protein